MEHAAVKFRGTTGSTKMKLDVVDHEHPVSVMRGLEYVISSSIPKIFQARKNRNILSEMVFHLSIYSKFCFLHLLKNYWNSKRLLSARGKTPRWLQ